MGDQFNYSMEEVRYIENLLHVDNRLLLDEYWEKIVLAPEMTQKVLTFLQQATRVYKLLDADSQAIVLSAVRNVVFYIIIKAGSNYTDMALDIALSLIEQKEITIAKELLLSKISYDDRMKVVGAIEKAGMEEEAIDYVLYDLWDGELTAYNCYIFLRLVAMFSNSTTMYTDEIRSAMRIFEEQEIGDIMEEPVLTDLLRRMPPFLIM